MKKIFQILSNNIGVTLAEVMVSVLIAGMVFAAMGALLTQSAVYARNLDIAYTATYLAERRIELLKRIDFEQIAQANETNIRIGDDGNIDANGKYLRTTAITCPYNGNSYLAKVRVEVYRVHIGQDGQFLDHVTGQVNYVGMPVVIETLLSNIKME